MLSFLNDHWGDIASVLGLFVSVIGFWFALLSLRESREASLKAKDAALRAEEAARATRDSIFKSDTIANCSQAIGILDEIKVLQRKGDWTVLPDRYSAVRRILVSMKSVAGQLTAAQVEILQGSLAQFTEIEKKIEASLASGKKPLTHARFNEVVSAQVDKLHEILIAMKQKEETAI
jgi:uroporphyrinogen-III synthase